jgi:hypothetical protein
MGVNALGGSITDPAWRTKPSWYLVATEDQMIPPPARRLMSERAGSTVVEVAGSHAIYVSQPAAVAALIEQAASAVDRRSKRCRVTCVALGRPPIRAAQGARTVSAAHTAGAPGLR